jgi:hypothetical protein
VIRKSEILDFGILKDFIRGEVNKNLMKNKSLIKLNVWQNTDLKKLINKDIEYYKEVL